MLSTLAGQGLAAAPRCTGRRASSRALLCRAEAKDIIFDEASRRAIQRGINQLADAVGVTLGPRGAPPPSPPPRPRPLGRVAAPCSQAAPGAPQAGVRGVARRQRRRVAQQGWRCERDPLLNALPSPGRNVVLEEKYGVPQVINDGVTIARAITLPDAAENCGAQLIKEVAGRTNDAAGDGTTTACVLARELIMCARTARRCGRRLEPAAPKAAAASATHPCLALGPRYGLQSVTAGANPVGIKRGMDKACAFLVEELGKLAKPVNGTDDIKAVATISAGNDELIGAMIADAIQKVGPDGVLSIESGTGLETTIEVEEGMELDRGYISPQFVTNVERLQVEMENCRVLVTDQKIEKIGDLIPLLEKITKVNVPLLIIAEDVTAEALATLVVNKLRQIVSVVAVKAPGFGERRKALLQDIAIVTGAEFVAKDLGMTVDAVELEQARNRWPQLCLLGGNKESRPPPPAPPRCSRCPPPTHHPLPTPPPSPSQLGTIRKLVVRKDTTTLIADAGSADEVRARVAGLKKELADATTTYDSEKLAERIAKLSGGVAVIKVGAATEAELEDRKLRVEDAKNATFAAVEEGVVPGGGAALVHLSALLTSFKAGLKDEELLGADIVQKAITAPCRLIASNAGVEGEVVVRRVLASPWAVGYNAMTDTYEDLLASGVLDPKKVTRSGLQNAVSVAGMVLTTQSVISEKPKKKLPAGAARGNGMPGMGEMSM